MLLALPTGAAPARAEFKEPWRDYRNALVLDAYELNALDWTEIVKNKRIAGFIGKATDGLPQEYCTERESLCGAQWRKYSVSRELYQTRRALAKSLGLKWGSYHLGRAGDPELQALHYLQVARPSPDEVIVLDIEHLGDERFMSLEDAERFVATIHRRLDRYPMLYTNHMTAKHIAANRADYPVLSRLKLWYARYKDDISDVFPMGNWDRHTLWQFSYGGNCNRKACPYRVRGTPYDIDVNIAPMTVDALRKAWPFDGLHEDRPAETAIDVNATAAVGNGGEASHSNFVANPDYHPQEPPPGSSLTAPDGETPTSRQKADAKPMGPMEGDVTAENAIPLPRPCSARRQEELESDDLADCGAL
ncbi:MAG: glycoside hydrolase family 25 [Nitratireductor sp.]|nr:glycoside hydrolase family 25 [Nitratireductor sp.]